MERWGMRRQGLRLLRPGHLGDAAAARQGGGGGGQRRHAAPALRGRGGGSGRRGAPGARACRTWPAGRSAPATARELKPDDGRGGDRRHRPEPPAVPGYRVAGKTGTAQIPVRGRLLAERLPAELRRLRAGGPAGAGRPGGGRRAAGLRVPRRPGGGAGLRRDRPAGPALPGGQAGARGARWSGPARWCSRRRSPPRRPCRKPAWSCPQAEPAPLATVAGCWRRR